MSQRERKQRDRYEYTNDVGVIQHSPAYLAALGSYPLDIVEVVDHSPADGALVGGRGKMPSWEASLRKAGAGNALVKISAIISED